ncbi:MAG: SagB/ThcOx family dehydrogenase [Candidatus Microgenomates bacterium]|jgi:SagB-type dehydrogenase family enzyme
MHKQYPRLPKISLSIKSRKNGLHDLIKKRSSFREFTGKPITKNVLSEILYYSAGITRQNKIDEDKSFRAYPSAGAKYPLEIYPLILFSKEIVPGLYHYNPVNNNLDILNQEVKKKETDLIWIKTQPWFKKAAVLLIITATFHRTTDKYKNKGMVFPYIEAGHLVQNVYLTAGSVGLGCCAIGGLHEKQIIQLLDINAREEYPIYYVALGS